MKTKILNSILSASFIISLALTFWLYYQYTNEIGDIDYDPTLDDPAFVVCHKKVFQYYSVGTVYHGGRKAMRDQFLNDLGQVEFEQKTGYIIFRFMVNCKGEAGRYRIQQVDLNLNNTTFNPHMLVTVQDAVERLNQWIPGTLKGKHVDSYYQIHFKIQKGKIIDIF